MQKLINIKKNVTGDTTAIIQDEPPCTRWIKFWIQSFKVFFCHKWVMNVL